MAQRLVHISGIGEVTLAKRQGASNLRLSVNSSGQVRVSMPYWTPYEAGILFVKSKRSWIQQHLQEQGRSILKHGDRIGKIHNLVIHKANPRNGVADIRIGPDTIVAKSDLSIDDSRVQSRLIKASERALKKQSEQLLPSRVEHISQKYGLPYNGLRIRKLTSRWGSCSTKKNINLSFFLIQLPWDLIDYVILHELAHTRYLNHGPEYWGYMTKQIPNVKELRQKLKSYKPRIEPAS